MVPPGAAGPTLIGVGLVAGEDDAPDDGKTTDRAHGDAR
jgi:hypothetical protein